MTLRAVNSPPWERAEGESDTEYLAFLSWLMTTPRPAPVATQLAGQRLWAERAAAFDQSVARPAKPRDQILAISQNLFALADLESEKLKRAAFKTDVPTLGMRDLVALCAYLAEIKSTLKELLDDPTDIDWDNLTDEQLEQLTQAHALMVKMRRSA